MNGKILCILLMIPSLLSFSQENGREYALGNYRKYEEEARKIKSSDKDASIENYRQYYSRNSYSHHASPVKLSAEECLDLLDQDGEFVDYSSSSYSKQQEFVGDLIFDAYNRLWKIAEAYRSGKLTIENSFTEKYRRAILYYGNMEISRGNDAPRFHRSCFGIPTAAANIYMYFLLEMDAAESGECTDRQKVDVCDMLKVVALQAWTQPLRGDYTDENVVQIDRFRKHVWWVGGNAIGYRPLFLCALMYRSVPMVDLIADVCQKSISTVSQHTYDDAFWDEGFTTDGAGWGHGKQNLIWGYPIDGTGNAIKMLGTLKESPWKQQLSKENAQALLNFFRGSNWYHYNGFRLPCLDRNSARYYEGKSDRIPYFTMLNNVIDDWPTSFTQEEQSELMQLRIEANKKKIFMDGYPKGLYSGTRWFFNNDDLVKKNADYHVMVNMASVRCDGLESAVEFADEYNFFTNDGLTLFQRGGDEYRKIIGAWDVTAYPGVTAREGMEKITPVTNWRGYNSKHNFAGSASHGGENAVAGFIFEKGDGTNREDPKLDDKFYKKNPRIYDVRAYKGYFFLGDYMVALGAGVTNLKPEMEGSIRTTIDQTAKTEGVYSIKNGKKEKITKGIHAFIDRGKPIWIAQTNGFAYTVLPEFSQHAYYTVETKDNEWVNRNKANENISNLPTKADILRLWIDHGQVSKDDTYGYVVYLGNDQVEDTLPFTVLRNDKNIQAVQSADKKITEAIFYNAKETLRTKGLTLRVSAPATVLIEDMGDEYSIAVNDPQMLPDLTQIVLSFNKKNITVDMPRGEFCGKPTCVRVKK